jgi:MFS family permease
VPIKAEPGFLRANARWLLAGLLLTLASSFGQTFFISVFSGDIRAAYDLSHGDFGGIYMAGTLASAAAMLLAGRVADVWTPRRAGMVVLAGLAATCALTAISTSAFFLFVIIFGLRFFGQGMSVHVAMTAMGRWYSRQRGRAVAIAGLGHQIGQATLPPLAVALALAIGWRETWLLSAAALLVLAMPALYLLLAVDRVPTSLHQTGVDLPEVRQWTRSEVLRDLVFWAINLGLLAPPFMGTAIYFHQVHLVETKGWQLVWFVSAYPLHAGMTVIASLIAGWITDRWDSTRLLPAFSLPLAAALFVLAAVDSWVAIPVFMVLMGVNSGVTVTVLGALWPEIYGIRHLGAVRSLVFAAMVFASALGPGIVGWLIDWSVPIATQIYVMAGYCLAALPIMALAARQLRRRGHPPDVDGALPLATKGSRGAA